MLQSDNYGSNEPTLNTFDVETWTVKKLRNSTLTTSDFKTWTIKKWRQSSLWRLADGWQGRISTISPSITSSFDKTKLSELCQEQSNKKYSKQKCFANIKLAQQWKKYQFLIYFLLIQENIVHYQLWSSLQ